MKWCLFVCVLVFSSCSVGVNLESLHSFGKSGSDITAMLKAKKLPIQYLDQAGTPLDILASPQGNDIQVHTIRTHIWIGELDCQVSYRFDPKGRCNELALTYDPRTNPKIGDLVTAQSILGMRLDSSYGKPRVENQDNKRQEIWNPQEPNLNVTLTSVITPKGQIFESLLYFTK